MASDMRWNPVSVNFNDASAFMRNAGDSLSKAGTVFGELRKSILDEEQRAIENAYKEKVFDENVRQFDTRLGWDKDRFGQEQAWNREKLGKEQELAYAQLAELAKYHQASIAQQARGNNLAEARFNREVALYDKSINDYNTIVGKMRQEEQAVKDYTKQEAKDMKDVWATGRAAWQNVTDLDKRIANAKDANELQYLMDEYSKNMDTYNTAKGVYQTYQANHMPQVTTPVGGTDIEKQRYVQMAMMANGSMPLPTPWDAGAASSYKVAEKQADAVARFEENKALENLKSGNRMKEKRLENNLGQKPLVDLSKASPSEQQNYLKFASALDRAADKYGKVRPSENQKRKLYTELHMPSTTWLGDVFGSRPTSGVFGPEVDYDGVTPESLLNPNSLGAMNIRNILMNLQDK